MLCKVEIDKLKIKIGKQHRGGSQVHLSWKGVDSFKFYKSRKVYDYLV